MSNYKLLKLLDNNIQVAGESYSRVLNLSDFGGNAVEATVEVEALSGTGVTLDIIPEYSYELTEESDWFEDVNAFTTVDNATILPHSETVKLNNTGIYVRFKYIVAGTSPDITFDLYANATVGSASGTGGTGGSGGGSSEFPAASAASDGYVNPTTTDIKAFGMLWNGTDWDRMPGDATLGVKVQDTLIPQAQDDTLGVIATQNKPLASGLYAWSSDSSSALEASSIVKASAGTLRRFSGYIDPSLATGVYYLQFFNSTTLPADATPVAANFIAPTIINHTQTIPSPINLDFSDNGLAFTTGLVWCLSTTAFSKTLGSAAVSATVQYK